MDNNETEKIVDLCYKGSRLKKKVHKIHIQPDNPMFLQAWEKSTKEIDLYNGWTKKVLRLEESEVIVLGMIRSNGPSGKEYLDIWMGLKSLFANRLLEAELTEGKKDYSANGLCPECFRKYLKENHNRLR